MTNKERAKVWGFCLLCAGVACAPLLIPEVSSTKADPLEKEFVCYDDGELVERHVGVENAYTTGDSRWEIHYVDSDIIAFYQQPQGETCHVEVVQ